MNFRKDKTNVGSLETFIEIVKKICSSFLNTTKERKALKSIQNDELRSYHLQDIRSRFLALVIQDYTEKIHYKLGGWKNVIPIHLN